MYRRRTFFGVIDGGDLHELQALQETNQFARAAVLLFLFRHHLFFGTRKRRASPIV